MKVPGSSDYVLQISALFCAVPACPSRKAQEHGFFLQEAQGGLVMPYILGPHSRDLHLSPVKGAAGSCFCIQGTVTVGLHQIGFQ